MRWHDDYLTEQMIKAMSLTLVAFFVACDLNDSDSYVLSLCICVWLLCYIIN